MSTGGTASKTSREIEVMKGSTMMARIRPAVSMPMPYGGPSKTDESSGTSPKAEIRKGWTYCCRKGAKTNRPQMP